MDKNSSVLIVGHQDALELALVRHLKNQNFTRIFSTAELGLNTTIQASVYEFFQKNRPEYVFLGSVRSGGIEANQKFSGDFIYQNIESQNNIVYAAHKFETKKLLYFGSSCMYPKEAMQPIVEEAILTGALEQTSESYAMAKLAGIKLIQAYRRQYGFNGICAVPATIYGPGCDTDLAQAHVLGALIAKFSYASKHKNPLVTLWGSGNPRREFIYSEDLAKASVLLMDEYDSEQLINIGVEDDFSIKELSEMIAEEVGFSGSIEFDQSKADGAMQKLLDSRKIKKLGWQPSVDLSTGIAHTIEWYNSLSNQQ